MFSCSSRQFMTPSSSTFGDTVPFFEHLKARSKDNCLDSCSFPEFQQQTKRSAESKANRREISYMRTRTGCLTCRLRHVKCDETKPVCDRCRRGERECVLADPAVNFRNMFSGRYDCNGRNSSRSNSGASREKHTTIRQLTFIKDSGHASAGLQCLNRRVSSRPTTTNSTADEIHMLQTPTSSGEALMLSPIHDELPTQGNTKSMPHHDTFEPCPSICRPLLPDQGLLGIASDSSAIATENSRSVEDSVSPLLSSQAGLFGDSGMLRSHRQAELLRFYKENWASGLDSQDDRSHFTIQVPQLALNIPILLNAIFAVASLHQSRLSGFSPSVAEEYHGKCVKLLLNMFEHDHAPMDDILLATIVILRVYEQMNGTPLVQHANLVLYLQSNHITDLSGSFRDNECHLLGASALASTHPSASGSLWKAAFWVYLRQDIYMAVVDQRPVRIDLSRCWLWRESQPRNDAEWSQLIMLIVAEITEFCFSHTTRDIEKWQVLREQLDEWHRYRPKTFEPYYFAERNVDIDRYFPEIWLSEQWHVTANIYQAMGQALLLIYDPNPVFGIEARRHQRIVQARMVEYARRICGICLSNPTSETWRTSCYAIHLCCPYITNQREQKLIIQILKETESKGAWPTASIIQALKEEWEPVSQIPDTERDLIYV